MIIVAGLWDKGDNSAIETFANVIAWLCPLPSPKTNKKTKTNLKTKLKVTLLLYMGEMSEFVVAVFNQKYE